MIRETWKVPELTDCKPGIEPFEFQCLVRMAKVEEKTAGGIFLTDATKSGLSWGADHARLIEVSPAAFSYHEWPHGFTKPKAGDVVFVGRFPGTEVEGKDGEKYRLINDREILAVVERAPTAEELAKARVNAAFAHITQPLEAAVERLFAEIGEDTEVFRTPGGNEVVTVANGAVKPEGGEAAPYREAEVIEATLSAIRAQFPNHATQRLIWRRKPDATVYPAVTPEQAKLWDEPVRNEQIVISLRIGADNIEEVNRAA